MSSEKPKQNQPPQQRVDQTTSRCGCDVPNQAVDEDPAVERGERIATGKHIARGGKKSGRVEGAEESKREG
jgi:hypothetical protein